MTKPSVLHIYKDFYPPIVGGIEKCIHWMCDQTRKEFHVRVLVASRNSHTCDEVVDGVRVIKAASLGRFLAAPMAPGFPSWIRRLDSDILHFHMPNPTGELAYLMSAAKGNVVVTYHSDIVRQRLTGLLYSPLQQRFLSHARLIMPTSRRYLESSATLQNHLERCRVVPLGIPLDQWAKTPESQAFARSLIGRTAGKTRIVFLGVLRYYKGLVYLLQAMQGLGSQVCLIIGGAGPERANLERQAADLGLRERILFLGELTDSQAAGLLQAGDIYCLPAHLRSEAFGLNQVEAMACGLPVVSTDLPTGVPEINRHGETGIIVPPANMQALREALETLVNNPGLRKQYGEAGKLRAQTHYSAKRMGEDISQAYRDVLALYSDEAAERSSAIGRDRSRRTTRGDAPNRVGRFLKGK